MAGINPRSGVKAFREPSIPFYADLARGDNYISLRAPMFHNIAQNCDILFAIGCNFFLLAGTPPFDGLKSVPAFRRAERVFRQLVQLHAVPDLSMQYLKHIERSLSDGCDRRISAQYFKFKPVAIEGDHVREIFKFGDELQRVILEPAPEAIVLIPRHRDGKPESANIGPAAFDFVRKAQSLDVQVYLSIE
jgi:hypothetical protein